MKLAGYESKAVLVSKECLWRSKNVPCRNFFTVNVWHVRQWNLTLRSELTSTDLWSLYLKVQPTYLLIPLSWDGNSISLVQNGFSLSNVKPSPLMKGLCVCVWNLILGPHLAVLKVISASGLRGCSWRVTRQGWNLNQPYTRKMPHPLYYISSPLSLNVFL